MSIDSPSRSPTVAATSTETTTPRRRRRNSKAATSNIAVLSYEDAAGDDRETLPYQVPVEVVPEPAGNVLFPAAVAVLAVLGFGVWYWRRR